MNAELQDRYAGGVVFQNIGREDAGRQRPQNGLAQSSDLSHSELDFRFWLEEHANHRDPVVGGGFHVLDVIDRSSHGAFGYGDDTVRHLFRRQSGVGPNDAKNGDIDVWKNVLGHRHDGDAAEHGHENGHYDEGIRTAKGKPNDP